MLQATDKNTERSITPGERAKRIREAHSLPFGWRQFTRHEVELIRTSILARANKHASLDDLETCLLLWSALVAVAEDLDWAAMIVRARQRFPNAEVRSLSLLRNDNGLITLRMRGQQEWLPNGRTTVWFAADTGEVIATRDAADLSRTVAAYNALYPLHAAKVGGLAFRIVMTLSGLALTLLGSLAVWSFWIAKPKRKTKPQHTAASRS